MNRTTSKDGTSIAYEKVWLGSGKDGPPLILVDGAFCRRSFGPMKDLAKALAHTFTVYHYDRRGRDESGDTLPYAVEREVEDLAAIFQVAGGSPYVYGISSGAALAIRGVGSGLPAKRLVLFEAPFALDGTRHADPPDFRERIAAFVAADQRSEAVQLFMKIVGVPGPAILFMRLLPNVWPKLKAVAHTLPYDFACLGETQSGGPMPEDLKKLLGAIRCPTLSLSGGKSPAWMTHSAKVVGSSIPGARVDVVPKADHNVSAKAMAPFLLSFFDEASPAQESVAC